MLVACTKYIDVPADANAQRCSRNLRAALGSAQQPNLRHQLHDRQRPAGPAPPRHGMRARRVLQESIYSNTKLKFTQLHTMLTPPPPPHMRACEQDHYFKKGMRVSFWF